MPPKNTKPKSGKGKSTAKAPAEAKPASSTGTAHIPKLKIHPPKRILVADTPEEEDSNTPFITPPPPINPAKVKAAVEELLDRKPLSVTLTGSDEDSDNVASNYSNKRKRAASDATLEAP